MALARQEGSEMMRPMAIAVIGGLLASTLLTLVVIPVVYSLVEKFSKRMYVNFEKIEK
jgi:multidrug efflux pump subunit AcrB